MPLFNDCADEDHYSSRGESKGPTADELEACKLIPLRQDVPWIDLSSLFPGTICEQSKNRALGNEFGAVVLGNSEVAAKIVKVHNEFLKLQKEG